MGKKLINPLLEVVNKKSMLINPYMFGSQMPSSGLVAYYPFNGNANDASGNGNNGTTSNVTLATGRRGDANNAYLFSKASSSYIDISSIGHLPNFAYSLWYKHNGSNNSGLFSKSSFASYQGDYAAVIGSVVVSFRLNNNAKAITKDFTWVTGNWYHCVFQFDGATMKVYINNVLQESIAAAVTLANLTNIIRLGQYYSTSYSLDGSLDDVRVYNRALTVDEIALLYNEA